MIIQIKVRLSRLMGKQGQSTLEYALIIGVVVAALVAMSVYVRRAIQANLKLIEDQINVKSQYQY